MPTSELALRLLQLHANRPSQLFYGTEALGSMFRDADLKLLDAAYEELERVRYMEPAGALISYFGEPKRLYRVTAQGAAAARGSAA